MGIQGSEAPCLAWGLLQEEWERFVSHQGVCSVWLNGALCTPGDIAGWQCGSAGSGGTEKTLKLNPLLPFPAPGHGLCCWCAWVSLERRCCPSSGCARLTCSASAASPAAQGTCRKGLLLLPSVVGRRAWLTPSRGGWWRCCAPHSIPPVRAVIPPEHPAPSAELLLEPSKCPFCISSDARGV